MQTEDGASLGTFAAEEWSGTAQIDGPESPQEAQEEPSEALRRIETSPYPDWHIENGNLIDEQGLRSQANPRIRSWAPCFFAGWPPGAVLPRTSG
ncbi:MAG: hypothetical protein R3E96_00180 [Planctomycetota bacterium]